SFSFIDTAHDEQFELLPGLASPPLSAEVATVSSATAAPFVTLENPILEGAVRMRPTLLPGLLQSVRHNLNHGIRDVRLFEIGRVFANSDAPDLADGLPTERESLALIATGGAIEEGRAQATHELDFYALKGALEAAVDA